MLNESPCTDTQKHIHTHTQTHLHTHSEANSQWLVFGAAPLSALNNIEAQVVRNARDLELCQMVLTFAYSTVQMLQMAKKTDNLKTKKSLDILLIQSH